MGHRHRMRGRRQTGSRDRCAGRRIARVLAAGAAHRQDAAQRHRRHQSRSGDRARRPVLQPACANPTISAKASRRFTPSARRYFAAREGTTNERHDLSNLAPLPNRAAALSPPSCSATTSSSLARRSAIEDLLEDWDANFSRLQEIVAAIEKDGRPGALKLASLRALPPVRRPGKMFYAAQNFQEHVDEMLRAGMTPAGGAEIHRREIDDAAVSVPQGAEHALPAPMTTSQSRAA